MNTKDSMETLIKGATRSEVLATNPEEQIYFDKLKPFTLLFMMASISSFALLILLFVVFAQSYSPDFKLSAYAPATFLVGLLAATSYYVYSKITKIIQMSKSSLLRSFPGSKGWSIFFTILGTATVVGSLIVYL